MIVRRHRRSTLALLLLIALCLGGVAVCYSADDEPMPAVDSGLETPPANDRPSPFYEDESDPPAAEARADRSPHLPSKISTKIPGVKLFSNPPKSPRPITEDAPAAIDLPIAREKTPLPKPVEAESSTSAETDVPPVARSRSNYGPSVIWAVGLLAAGLIIRQVLKAGGSLANNTPTVIEVMSRQTMGPQQQLAIVRFGQRLLLVGTTSSSMTTLAQVEDPEEVQSLLAEIQSSSSGAGRNVFGRLRQRRSSTRSRADRSRWANEDRTSPEVSISLSTESRTAAAHERRTHSTPSQEVSDE